MKHQIIGVAGHIDHGKTLLVKALTGVDCDTHKEEKRRGITINLGFTHLTLPTNETVGIIDMPGHRDFIRTMVSGASGIDCVLMVIAADGGVMPQTREHCSICEMLGVKTGIVVITRIDLVNEEQLKKVRAEIAAFTKDTFLQNSPLIQVSSKTGLGIPELTNVIATTLAHTTSRENGHVFRMYIDRIFSISGYGTVVTGSVKSGSLSSASTAFLLPQGKEVRIRRLERYGEEVRTIEAGDRASLNIVGLSKHEFVRGMLISDKPLQSTQLLDVKIQVFDAKSMAGDWVTAIYIMGTFESQVKIHILDKNAFKTSNTTLAQIHLPVDCCAVAHEAFVLRSTSSEMTIGGGIIIDPHPLHHRRHPPSLVNRLHILAQSESLRELVIAEASKYPGGIGHSRLALNLNVSPQEIETIITNTTLKELVVVSAPPFYHLISHNNFLKLSLLATKNIKDFHASHPLTEVGRTVDELQGILGIEFADDNKKATTLLLDRLIQQKTLKKVGNSYALANRAVTISPKDKEQCTVIEQFITQCGMQTPVFADLALHAKKHGIDDKRLRQLLKFLVTAKVLYEVEGQYLLATVVDTCRTALRTKLSTVPQGLTVAEFRDLVLGNRKICLLLFAIFDAEGITKRQGDVRIITEKGRLI